MNYEVFGFSFFYAWLLKMYSNFCSDIIFEFFLLFADYEMSIREEHLANF